MDYELRTTVAPHLSSLVPGTGSTALLTKAGAVFPSKVQRKGLTARKEGWKLFGQVGRQVIEKNEGLFLRKNVK